MIIAFSSSGKEPEALLSPHFGRCSHFAFFNEETGEWEFEANGGASETSGAGIKAAQQIIDRGAQAVLTGEVGPKAWKVLQTVSVEVYRLPEVSLEEALKVYQEGGAQKLGKATVNAHTGMSTSESSSKGKKEKSAYYHEAKRRDMDV